MAKGWADRRKSKAPRVAIQAPATVEKAISGGRFQYGRAVNISRSGVGMQVFGELETGTPVHVTVHLPGQSAVTCSGWVAWADKPVPTGSGAVGIAFLVELDGALISDIASKRPPAERNHKAGGA